MTVSRNALIGLARQKAALYQLDGDLICAIVEQESDWQPFAIRFEKDFLAKYVAPLFTAGKITATEAYARSFSWGLMQVMGQVAREEGFLGASLAELTDPELGLDAGCKHFAAIAKRIGAAPDADVAYLLAWNGGGNPAYPSQVLARLPAYNA